MSAVLSFVLVRSIFWPLCFSERLKHFFASFSLLSCISVKILYQLKLYSKCMNFSPIIVFKHGVSCSIICFSQKYFSGHNSAFQICSSIIFSSCHHVQKQKFKPCKREMRFKWHHCLKIHLNIINIFIYFFISFSKLFFLHKGLRVNVCRLISAIRVADCIFIQLGI